MLTRIFNQTNNVILGVIVAFLVLWNIAYPGDFEPRERSGTATQRKSLDRASLETMSRTLLGECGRCGDAEIKAIGHVILNRLRSGRYGEEITDVVTFKRKGVYHFATWDPRWRNEATGRHVDRSKAFARMKRLAADIWQEKSDPTGGAVNFFHPRAMQPVGSVPYWTKHRKGVRIGGAIFFR